MAVRDPYSLRETYDEMTLALILSLSQTLESQLDRERDLGITEWQLLMLRNQPRFRRKNWAIISSYNREIEETISEVIESSFQTGGARAEREILRVLPRITLPERDINRPQLQVLKNTVTADFNRAQYGILRRMDSAYREIIQRAELQMRSGTKTLLQAIDSSSREFLNSGIRAVMYRDGRLMNIASYAEMALRTASQRAIFLGEGEKRSRWGVYTVVVSAHANTCDFCLPWQRQVLIDDVYSGGRPNGEHRLVSEAMREGLFHPNCRHLMSTYFPGITERPGSIDERVAQRTYDAEQEQRYMERQIRKWKRREAGSLDPENKQVARNKVRKWQRKLEQYLEENPELRRTRWRERIQLA